MYNKSLEQLKLFYNTLIRLQDTMLAVYQCNVLSDQAKDRVREKIILQLVGGRQLRQTEDSKRRGSEKTNKATKEKAAGAA